jgi:hypothetical protein
MGRSKLLAAIAVGGLGLCATAAAAPASPPRVSSAGHRLFQSRQLWATVNVCNPKDKPNSVGIRGSMPGDGRPSQTMYMRFRLQYLDSTTNKWVDVAQGADSGLIAVGSARAASQGGLSFQLVPPRSNFELRGVVVYQWRQGKRVVHAVSRATSAGHTSLKGADPPGFSAATCTLG